MCGASWPHDRYACGAKHIHSVPMSTDERSGFRSQHPQFSGRSWKLRCLLRKCTPLWRSQDCSVFQVICFEKERFLAEFPFFLCGPLGEIKKEVLWDKQFWNFADGRIDRETNSKGIFYINKSIDEYILQEINWRQINS